MTTLSDTDLLDGLRDFLVSEGIARVPRVGGAEPPLWIEPRDGIPAPGEGGSAAEIGSQIVLAAFRTGGVPHDRMGGAYLRKITVDIRMRAMKPMFAYEVDAKLYKALHDKTAWSMGAFTVIESLQVRELQRLGSDNKGFDFVTEYLFECYA